MLFEKPVYSFSQSQQRDMLDPSSPRVRFYSLFKDTLRPPPLHNKSFIKKGSLQEMEGFNDDASALVHLNTKIVK